MCFLSGLTRLSIYLRAFCPTGSCGVATPDLRRPVRTMPVAPGLLAVLQPPFLSWVLCRNLAAFWATASQVFLSGPTLATWAGASAIPQLTRQVATQDDLSIVLFILNVLMALNLF